MQTIIKNKTFKKVTSMIIMMTMVLGIVAFYPTKADAHCDAKDGPVATAAKNALEAKNVDIVLPYVSEEGEQEVIDAFNKTLIVREKGKESQELADNYFLETVVRVHREGEGAPYTGLKPAGIDYGPALPAAERAIETGSDEELRELMHTLLDEAIDENFEQAKKVQETYSDENTVEANRKIVNAEFRFEKFILGIYESFNNSGHDESEESKEIGYNIEDGNSSASKVANDTKGSEDFISWLKGLFNL